MRKHKKKGALHNCKFIKFASYSCFIVPVLFIIALGILASINGLSYEEMIAKNPILTVGYIISIINLLLGFLLRKIAKAIHTNGFSDCDKIIICISAITLFTTFNYISSIALLIQIIVICRYEKSSPFVSMKLINKKELLKMSGLAAACLISVLMSYWFMKSFS